MFCSFYDLILYMIWFHFYLHVYFITLIIMSTSILHLFFFTYFLLLKMHYLDHILECPIGPSLKVVQLRRLFDGRFASMFWGQWSHLVRRLLSVKGSLPWEKCTFDYFYYLNHVTKIYVVTIIFENIQMLCILRVTAYIYICIPSYAKFTPTEWIFTCKLGENKT